jgi:hypothetical protein
VEIAPDDLPTVERKAAPLHDAAYDDYVDRQIMYGFQANGEEDAGNTGGTMNESRKQLIRELLGYGGYETTRRTGRNKTEQKGDRLRTKQRVTKGDK